MRVLSEYIMLVILDGNSYVKVDSTSDSFVKWFYNSSQVGSIVTTGSGTIYLTSSDYRLKENAVELTGALDRLDNLQPKRFNFISHPNETLDGFMAHEVSDMKMVILYHKELTKVN